MANKLLAAAAVLLISASAGAAPARYDFEWKGLEWRNEWLSVWDPNATVSGYFHGDDLDGSGAIEIGELTRFGMEVSDQSWEFFGCPDRGPGIYGVTGCQLHAFTYSAEGGLSFIASAQYSLDGIPYQTMWWNAPHYFSNVGDFGQESTLYWTEQTQLTVVSSIPEPSTWAMLCAGLIGVARAARETRRARRTGTG